MSLLVLGSLAGCRSAQPNSTCEWPRETAISLDLSKPMQQQHLSDDALFAEDLAIRYADSRCGPRSGHFEGFAEYGRTREQCMVALLQLIGNNHGVTQDQVRRSLVRRRTSLDLAVIVSFAVLYGLVANVVARRICHRFPPAEGRLAGVVATVLTSFVVGTGEVLLGEIWSLTIENLRVGNGHQSYRVARIPWTQQRLGILFGSMLLFWLFAGLHYRGAVRAVR